MYGLRIENLQDDSAALPGDGWIELGRELTIGRGKDNVLVLDDPIGAISKHHCTISNVDNGCVLTDHSRNGSFLNCGAHAVGREKPIPLKAGDILQIGHYVLTMVGADGGGSGDTHSVPLSERSFIGAILQPPCRPRHVENLDFPLALGGSASADIGNFVNSELTAEDSLMLAARTTGSSSLTATGSDHSVVTSMVYVQPRLSTKTIPDDWDILSDLGNDLVSDDENSVLADPCDKAAEIQDAPARAFIVNAAGEAILAFLEGCGLQSADLKGKDLSAVMLRAGQALKVTVSNLQEEFAWKNGVGLLRPPEPMEVNPMKFTRGLRDVTLNLLAPGPGRLVAHEAINRAFEELRQQAAAARLSFTQALRGTLERLAPEVIENQAADTLANRHLPVVRMAEHWKRYCRDYPEIVADAERLADDSRAASSRHQQGSRSTAPPYPSTESLDEADTTGAETPTSPPSTE